MKKSGVLLLLGSMLMGAFIYGWTPSPSLAAQPSVRAAFYYPWYPETWSAGTNYHPSLGQYDSSQGKIIGSHIRQMQSAGIQAGIASWWGQGSQTDSRIPKLLNKANTLGTGFKWTLYVESEGQRNPTVANIQDDLSYISSHYASNPSFLQVNGKPVLFVYGDAADNCGMVDRWTQANAGQFYLVLKVFGGYAACANQPDSWHQYSPAVGYDQQGTYSATVSPGFWKAGEASPRLARDPARFTTDVASMVNSGAQWQLISTFNEWGEGTSVEKATEWGRTYLDILKNAGSTSTTPPPPSNATVVIYMENHERSSIETSTTAPYLHSFEAGGISFTNYYGVTHPSLPNYLALGNGSTDGKSGTDSISPGSISGTTVWNQANAAGVPWRVLEESMPSACSSAVTSGSYALKHNPATPFSQVFNDPSCSTHVLPFTGATQIVDGINFIAPNLCNDMHDCSIQTGDTWLANHVPAMLAAGATVVITFDEGSSGTNGGGNVYTAVDGPGIAPRTETATYNHYSLLAGIEAKYGLSKLGGAATATPLPLK